MQHCTWKKQQKDFQWAALNWHTLHVWHMLCETFRVLYPSADKLVANGKEIFVKSPARLELLKNNAPDTPLPPTPVITRRGTWFDATVLCRKMWNLLFCGKWTWRGRGFLYYNIERHISGVKWTEGAKDGLGLRSYKLQFSVAVYNKVGNDHKFIVMNNKRNQRHWRRTEKIKGSKADAVKQTV
jgi:hypothetical protein